MYFYVTNKTHATQLGLVFTVGSYTREVSHS